MDKRTNSENLKYVDKKNCSLWKILHWRNFIGGGGHCTVSMEEILGEKNLRKKVEKLKMNLGE